MEKDEYMRINSERGSLQKAKEHCDQKDVCKFVKQIVRGTLLCGRLEDMLSLDQIIKLLMQAKFRKL